MHRQHGAAGKLLSSSSCPSPSYLNFNGRSSSGLAIFARYGGATAGGGRGGRGGEFGGVGGRGAGGRATLDRRPKEIDARGEFLLANGRVVGGVRVETYGCKTRTAHMGPVYVLRIVGGSFSGP